MLKKRIGTIIAAGAVSLLLASGASASGDVEQSQSGPATISFGEVFKSKLGNSVTGVQFQGGTGTGTYTQKSKTNFSSTVGGQTTTVTAVSKNETITQKPTQVSQTQIERTSSIEKEASFVGGPTIQYQQLQRSSFNYQLAVKSVAPTRK